MKFKTDRAAVPYSYLIDNLKVLLIFLVVFNHIIAFNLVKVDIVVRYIWYAITIFHMPAFIFVSGYLSKKPQNVFKNVKNLLIPYILGYSLTWYTQIWLGKSTAYELLRPTGTVMWYVLALFIYRLTIEGLGKIRFAVPLSIAVALWAGTRAEFSTFLSASRIVVFFPFFVAGYLWKSDYITAVRKFKGKWVLVPISGILLVGIPNYMITNNISFIIIYTLLALIPDIKLPITYIGRHTMGIYFFHYPILIIMNGLYLLMIPQMNNVWALLGVSFLFLLVLGSLPVDLLYTGVLNLIAFVLFKTNKTVTDEGLEEEYDSDEDKYEQLLRRRKAIEELAATLDDEKEPAGQEYHGEKMDQDEDTVSEHMDRHEGSSQVAGLDVDIEEDNFDLPEETVEEERELTLEELMQELEAATREMQKQNPPEEVKK